MLHFINSYVEFIFRPLPNLQSSAIDEMPNFFVDTLFWTFIFSLIYILTPILSKIIFPSWYSSLEKRKRSEYPSYVACLFHHFVMVPIGWTHIIKDYYLSSDELASFNYGASDGIASPFCIGYLAADTICYAIKEAFRGKFEYMIHHTLVLTLVIATTYGPSPICRFIPHLLICDTSQLLFNSAWLLRLFGMRGSPFVLALELLFAFAFLITRAINMPMAFWALSYSPSVSFLGYARFTLIPIVLLQWYWLFKILSTVSSRISGTTATATAKQEKLQ